MPKHIKENVIEEELLRRVKAAGGVCEKVTVLGNRGFFDRLVVLPKGRVVFAECKRPSGGKFAAHQILRQKRYRALGAEVVVVKNFGDIDRLMAAG